MKKLVVFVLLIVAVSSYGQPGFIKSYNETPEGLTNYMDVLVDSDTIVLYSISKDTMSHWGIRFAKLDSFGNVLQERFFVDSVDILTTTKYRKKIVKTYDGGYAIFGGALSSVEYLYLLKVKHDLSLDFLERYYPEDSLHLLNSSLVETPDGFMLTGEVEDLHYHANPIGTFVIKTDRNGMERWRKVYGQSNRAENTFEIKMLDENTFVLSGVISSGGLTAEKWNRSQLKCIDSLGNVKWEWKSELTTDMGWVVDFEMLPDSGWICLSSTYEPHPVYTWALRPVIYRLDKDFNVVWYWRYDLFLSTQFWKDLEWMKDGSLLASGWLFDGDNSIMATHYKFNVNGDSLWFRQDSIFEGGLAWLLGTDILSSGSIISVGFAEKGLEGPYGFVMKLSPDGCIDTLSCWPVADYEPFTQADEVSVYPNPFSDYLTVSIPDYPQNAYIYFYDVMGRFLRKERVRHGVNELDVTDFPKGMVFYEVWDGGVLIGRGKLVRDFK